MPDVDSTQADVPAQLRLLARGVRTHLFLIALALSALAVFAGYHTKIINLFYGGGAYFLDTGWYAYLLSRFDIPPANPQVFIEDGFASYFSFHLAIIMPLWGALADLMGWSPPQAMAAFQGAIHVALLVAGVLLGRTVRTAHPEWAGLGLGLALVFSPVTLDAIGYPHTEIAIPVLIVLTLVCIGIRAWAWAVVAFALCVCVRQDAGFHLFAFLMTYVTLDWIQHRRLRRSRPLLLFAAAGFACSLIGFLVKGALFPELDTFGVVYAGDHFSHLSPAEYVRRVRVMIDSRPELPVLFAIPVVSALLTRRLADLAGALAVGPWMLLNLSAANPAPAQMFAYYAFPLLVMHAWPFLRALLDGYDAPGAERTRLPASAALSFFVLSALALVFYFTMPFGNPGAKIARHIFFQAFQPQVTALQIQTTDSFRDALEADIAAGRRILMDDAMVSLSPESPRVHRYNSNDIPAFVAEPAPFAVVFFRPYLEGFSIRQNFASRPDAVCHVLPGTNIGAVTGGEGESALVNAGVFLRPIPCAAL